MSHRIHDFHERNDWSLSAEHDTFWDKVYRRAFTDLVRHEKEDRKKQQLKGIDRYIWVKGGARICIDEKLREVAYPDILLEYVSNDRAGTPGWIEKDLSIDYVAYAIKPTRTVYFLPWYTLRVAWDRYGAQWKKNYKPVPAQNQYYTTWCCPVPIKTLQTVVSVAIVKV